MFDTQTGANEDQSQRHQHLHVTIDWAFALDYVVLL